MTNFIPVFPLGIVVYPTEPLNLHIFEPRYKQLINECLGTGKIFGIPAVIDKKVQEFGTTIRIKEMVKEYDNGEMDIKVEGVAVFRMLEFIRALPDKLYSGAIVSYPDNILSPEDSKLGHLILSEVKRMYALLNVEDKLPSVEGAVLSYKIAHFTGMTLKQEQELLQLFTETQRLEYLRQHLSHMLPTLKGLEEAKKRIKLNGHFRDLSLEDF